MRFMSRFSGYKSGHYSGDGNNKRTIIGLIAMLFSLYELMLVRKNI